MINTRTFTLPCGMRVIYHHDPSSVMVTFNTLFATGARDEGKKFAGMAHLFEHLMFGGSKNVPDFSSSIQYAGGNDNAWTSLDFTNYYTSVPAVNIETLLRAESDRWLFPNLDLTTIETQKKVVIQEFRDALNRPYGDLSFLVHSAFYDPDGPYGHPVLGCKPEDIALFRQEDVRAWYKKYYTPSNAVLAVTGNISLSELEKMLDKWYGDLPSETGSINRPRRKVFLDKPKSLKATGKVAQSVITVLYRIAPYGEDEYFAADLLTDILSEGRAARFQQNLVEKNDALFTQAEASVTDMEHGGSLMLTGVLAKEDLSSLESAAETLMKEASRLAEPGNISQDEICRVLNRRECRRALDLLNPRNRAETLARCLFHNEDINEEIPRLRQIDIFKLTSAANSIFSRQPASILYTPAGIY